MQISGEITKKSWKLVKNDYQINIHFDSHFPIHFNVCDR